MPTRLKVFILFLILVASSVGVFIGISWSKLHQPAVAQSADSTKELEIEISKTVEEVGKVLLLPADEVPSQATVTDLSKLKDQPFFAQAQVGDKVLIFSVSRKVILWRPSIHKVIEVSALEINVPE